MADVIGSTGNPIAKRIRALTERKARKREGVFLVEGMQPVWRAAESEWKIETLILAPDLIKNPAVDGMASRLEGQGSRIVHLTGDLFTKLSGRDGPAGVMAIVETRATRLHQLEVGQSDAWVMLHRVHNPGNLGTIIRTADAAGMAGVVLVGDSTDPFAPASVKASMGSIFSIPLVIEHDVDVALSWARKHGLHLVGTSGYADTPHWNMEFRRPLCMLLGNEGDGLPQELLENVDSTVRIPMTGSAESLNLSVAAALLMYEVQRHRIG